MKQRKILLPIFSVTIIGILLAGCSSTQSSQQPTATPQPSPTLNQTQTNNSLPSSSNQQVNLTVTSPNEQQRTFKPGSTIPISGKVTGAVQTNQQITVSLYWGDRPQSDRLISKQSFALSADGSFQRNFQVPNTSFPGATGGQFVMTFEFPNAQTQTIPMSILTVKPGQTQ